MDFIHNSVTATTPTPTPTPPPPPQPLFPAMQQVSAIAAAKSRTPTDPYLDPLTFSTSGCRNGNNCLKYGMNHDDSCKNESKDDQKDVKNDCYNKQQQQQQQFVLTPIRLIVASSGVSDEIQISLETTELHALKVLISESEILGNIPIKNQRIVFMGRELKTSKRTLQSLLRPSKTTSSGSTTASRHVHDGGVYNTLHIFCRNSNNYIPTSTATGSIPNVLCVCSTDENNNDETDSLHPLAIGTSHCNSRRRNQKRPRNQKEDNITSTTITLRTTVGTSCDVVDLLSDDDDDDDDKNG